VPVRTSSFDPLDPAYLADPYPLLAELPAAFHAPGLDMWVLTRFADIEAVFRDPATFSPSIGAGPDVPAERRGPRRARPGLSAAKTMSQRRAPVHTRIPAVQPAGVLRPAHRRAGTPGPGRPAVELVDALPASGPFDLVAGLSHPLPAFMIFTLIGFPPEDTELLKSWCGNRMAFSWGHPTPRAQLEIAGNMRRYWTYCAEFVQGRIAEPRDDFTSDLVRIHLADPTQLSPAGDQQRDLRRQLESTRRPRT